MARKTRPPIPVSKVQASPGEGSRAETSAPDAARTTDAELRAVEEVSVQELREFLEADWLGSEADPAFRERLRRRLWQWVRSRYRGGPPPAS